jgi:hypothetical protein
MITNTTDWLVNVARLGRQWFRGSFVNLEQFDSTSQHESWHSSKINDNSSFSSIHPTSFQVSDHIGKSRFQQLTQIQYRFNGPFYPATTSLAG